MTIQVGSITYDVALETAEMIRGSRAVKQEVNRVGASFDGLGSKLSAITSAIKLMAAALAVVKSAQFADEMRLLAARVQVAAGSIDDARSAMVGLQAISARTQTELSANAQVFTRLNQSIKQMGGTQNDTLRVTELLGMAVKVSGASAQESASAMLQFGQALGSGKLAGDELRSLLENAPYLMRQLADGLGVPIGALKGLGEQGKLTADVVVNALSKAAGRIEDDFKKMPQTLASAMAVATDAAARANEALDTLTGTSAALTGVTKGVGDVFDLLARQLLSTTTEADKLGRNDLIKGWAETTTLVLTYVVDAADLVVRMFRQTGEVIYQTAAAAAAAARGGFAEAQERLVGLKKILFDIGDAQYAGARMRQAVAAVATTPAPDRLDRLARTGTTSNLKSPPGAGDGKASFDVAAYLAGLAAKTAEGLARVDVIEQEALRKNKALLAQGKINRQQAAEAAVLIEQDAAQQREDIMFKEATDNLLAITRAGEQETAERKRLAEQQSRGQSLAQGIIVADDPVAKLQIELEAKSALLNEYAILDQANLQLYADARVALERDTQAKMAEIRDQQLATQAAQNATSVSLASSLAGNLYSVLEKSGQQQTALGKALFLVSKGLAVAEIILNTEVAAAKAGAQLGIYGIPLASFIRASGYASAALVAGTAIAEVAGGRQYGGPADAGGLYRVNETGRPEMFTAANGSQYLLPTQSGSVTSADKVGGTGGVQVNVHNYAGADIQTSTSNDGRVIDIAVKRAKAEIASDIAENNGQVWSALRSGSNVQPRI